MKHAGLKLAWPLRARRTAKTATTNRPVAVPSLAPQPPAPQRALLVMAHPALQRSRVNAALYKAVADLADTVSFHDLYEAYADFSIDIEAEQQRLIDHDLIVLQFPLYWYSTPSLLKEWLDIVWQHGFAYGRSGDRLHGKQLLCAVTTGGDLSDYGPEGRNRYSVTDFLRPLEATAGLCGLHWVEPFITHDALQLGEPAIRSAARAYRARLTELIAALPARVEG